LPEGAGGQEASIGEETHAMIKNLAAWLTATVMVVVGQYGVAAVTYIDATTQNTLGVVSGLADWYSGDDFAGTTGSTDADGLWRFRINQGPVGSGAGLPAARGIWEASSATATQEDAVEIKTTVTGVPNGTYDIYVFYCSFAAENNRIRAGFTSNPNMNTLYDKDGSVGIAGKLALEGLDQLTFDNVSFTADDTEKLYYAVIGQTTVTTGEFSVFIDDFPAAGTVLANRTWYSGIGYSLPGIVVPVLEIDSVASGLASAAATWSNNAVPSSANNYNVLSGHIVSIDQSFPGRQMVVKSGGTANFSASNVDINNLIIETGASLTETVAGDFILGMPINESIPLGVLNLQSDVSVNVGAGETFIIGLAVTGPGNMNLNTGAGSIVRLADSQGHQGAIRFNGQGDLFTLEWDKDVQTVEMNSTGQNRFEFLQGGQVDNGNLIFNQPGTMAHRTTRTDVLGRLVAIDYLEANAPVTVEVKDTLFTGNPNAERRMQIANELRGSANVAVIGSDADPSATLDGIGMHEFEIGAQGEPSTIAVDSYSGTLSATKFVNVEIRHSVPAAKVVVNDGARLEMGHDVTGTSKSIVFGEIEVGNGGVLEIGFEDTETNFTGHQVGHLHVTTSGGRNGNLTLAAGSKTVVQVNGTAANEFDTAVVEGNIVLGGNLEVWFKPPSTNATPNPDAYIPMVNDTFVIMSLSGSSLQGDFTSNNVVDGADLATWTTAFGQTADADADDDDDSDGVDFLIWQQDYGKSVSVGTITGNFADVVAPSETPWPVGLDFTTEVVGNEVRLRVTSAPAAVGSLALVPEPATGWMTSIGVLAVAARRHRQAAR